MSSRGERGNNTQTETEEAERWNIILIFQTAESEEIGAAGAVGEPASKIFYHRNFLSISAIKKMS